MFARRSQAQGFRFKSAAVKGCAGREIGGSPEGWTPRRQDGCVRGDSVWGYRAFRMWHLKGLEAGGVHRDPECC